MFISRFCFFFARAKHRPKNQHRISSKFEDISSLLGNRSYQKLEIRVQLPKETGPGGQVEKMTFLGTRTTLPPHPNTRHTAHQHTITMPRQRFRNSHKRQLMDFGMANPAAALGSQHQKAAKEVVEQPDRLCGFDPRPGTPKFFRRGDGQVLVWSGTSCCAPPRYWPSVDHGERGELVTQDTGDQHQPTATWTASQHVVHATPLCFNSRKVLKRLNNLTQSKATCCSIFGGSG